MVQPRGLIFVFDRRGCGEKRPIRSPDAAVDAEVAHEHANDLCEILIGKASAGYAKRGRQLDYGRAFLRKLPHLCPDTAVAPYLCRIRHSHVIDHQAQAVGTERRQDCWPAVTVCTDLQKPVETAHAVEEVLHGRFENSGRIAVEEVQPDADNACLLEGATVCLAAGRIDHCDTLEAPGAAMNGTEHGRIA